MQAVRRRRLAFLIVFVLGIGPVIAAPLLMAPIFRSSSTVSIQAPAEVTRFGKEVLPGGPQPLASVMAIVNSDRVLGRVVDQLPADSGPGDPSLTDQAFQALGMGEEAQSLSRDVQRQFRIGGIRKSLELTEQGAGTVLVISAYASGAIGSVFLANSIADAFVSYQAERRREASRAAVTWLNKEARELRANVERRNEAMSRIVGRLGRDPTREQEDGGGLAAQTSIDLQQSEVDLRSVDGQIAQLERRVASAPTPDETSKFARLKQLQGQLEAARLQFTANHPEVRGLEEMVADLELQVGDLATASPESFLAPGFRADLQSLRAERAALSARVSSLRVLDKRDAKEVDPADSDALAEYDRLEREAEVDEQMLEVLMQRASEALLTAASETTTARVLDYATVPMEPVRPRKLKMWVLGLLGLIGAAGALAFLLELIDRRMYDVNELAQSLGTPCLGAIPSVGDGSDAEHQTALEYSTRSGEGYRNLRTAIQFASAGADLKSLLVTSAYASVGKSTTAINLAQSFALAGRRVALVDADLRRPRLHKVLGLSSEPGLTQLLRGELDVDDVLRRPAGFDVDVITSGGMPNDPVELLGGPRGDAMIAELESRYDLVILDAPVVLGVADAVLLGSRADGILLVEKPGNLDRSGAQKMCEQLHRANARLLGFVLNQVNSRDPYQYPQYARSPYLKNESRWARLRKRMAATRT